MNLWVLPAFVVAVAGLIWLWGLLTKPCTGHERECPGCKGLIRIFHNGDNTSMIGHEPPECHWFTQNMQKQNLISVEELDD
jgi:hypothetical protein